VAEPKTRPTKASVTAFIDEQPDPARRADCRTLVRLMTAATRQKPVMWGPSIVGFGSYTYAYSSGKELTWPLLGFSPRKQQLVVYIMPGEEKYKEAMARLGPHSFGKSCLYIKRLADVDQAALRKILATSVKEMKRRYPALRVAARPRATRSGARPPSSR
jgi:hypothetical protein